MVRRFTTLGGGVQYCISKHKSLISNNGTYRSRVGRITIRNSQGTSRLDIIHGRNLTVTKIIECNFTVGFGRMVQIIRHGSDQFGTDGIPNFLEAGEGNVVCLHHMI